jgi:Tfp pilus assembly protein PilX
MTKQKPIARQRGLAMVIGMIMLVLLTLLVVSAINSSSVNLRITGNMQAQDEARAMAQQAIERVLGVKANFYPTPTAQAATNYYADSDSSGNAVYSVSVAAPVCKGAAKQFPGRTADCINGARAGLFCWDTLWEVVATATDTKTGVRQVITQGVAIPFEPGFNPATVSC